MKERILQCILTLTQTKNIDHGTIYQAEKYLKDIKSQKQANLIPILISISECHHLDHHIFVFSVNELIKLSAFFSSFSEIQREEMKLKLFQILETIKADLHRNLLCKYISSLVKQEAIDVPSLFIPNIQEIFRCSNIQLYESAFKILKAIIINKKLETFNSNELQVLFENGLLCSNSRVQVACIKAICSYLQNTNSKKSKYMSQLIPLMIECLYQQSQEDSVKAYSILKALNKVSKAKLFENSFELLFSVIWNMNIKQINVSSELQQLSLETVVQKVQDYPTILNKNNDQIPFLFKLILNHMSQIDKDIVEEWSIESHDNFYDDLRFEKVNLGMKLLNRIFESVEDKTILQILLEQIEELFTKSDWRQNFVAIMAESQIVEYIEDEEQAIQIINQTFPFLENKNPILRYAVFHLIGLFSESKQFSSSMKHQFQLVIFQHLDDPVPKVTSHAAAAITNYLEGIGNVVTFQQFIKSLYEKLLLMIKNSDNLIVKESCITAVASIVLSVKFKFKLDFVEFIPILFSTLSTFKGRHHSKLVALTIECLTIISLSIEKQVFLPYLQDLVSVMISIQNSIVNTQDENKSYAMTSWQRIFNIFSIELVPFLPQIVPGLFHLIDDVFQNNKIDKSSLESIIEVTLEMLSVFIDKFKNNIFVNIDQIVEKMELISQFNDIESIKKEKSNCISGLVACSTDNRGTQQILARQLLQTLHYSYKIKDIQVLATNISDMAACINKIGNFLTQQEISKLTEIIKNVYLDQKIQDEGNNKEDYLNNAMMEIEDDKEEEIEKTNDSLNQIYEEASDLLEVLFKTHKQQTLCFAEDLYSQDLQNMLKITSSKKNNKYGLFIMDSMIEFLGFEFFKDKLDYFINNLKSFLFDQMYDVRQAAIYGIGIFAMQTPQEVFFPLLSELVQQLQNSYNLPQGMNLSNNIGFQEITLFHQLEKQQSVNHFINKIFQIFGFFIFLQETINQKIKFS